MPVKNRPNIAKSKVFIVYPRGAPQHCEEILDSLLPSTANFAGTYMPQPTPLPPFLSDLSKQLVRNF